MNECHFAGQTMNILRTREDRDALPMKAGRLSLAILIGLSLESASRQIDPWIIMISCQYQANIEHLRLPRQNIHHMEKHVSLQT